jgi:hypothetical protein
LHLCLPAIYLIAGTGDDIFLETTDWRFELHSPLSLVSKRIACDFQHSQFIAACRFSFFDLMWNLFGKWRQWTHLISVIRRILFNLVTCLLRVTCSHQY